MSSDIRELIVVAALFTGMDQLLPKDTIVKAFVKKLVNTLSGVKCLVMNVCPYRSSSHIMRPSPKSPTSANAVKPASRTARVAHFWHLPPSQNPLLTQQLHPSQGIKLEDDLTMDVAKH